VRKYILIAAILANGPALSQEAKPFTFTVTSQELAIIAKGLGEQPYKDVAVLLQKLDGQLRDQQPKPATPSAPPAAEGEGK